MHLRGDENRLLRREAMQAARQQAAHERRNQGAAPRVHQVEANRLQQWWNELPPHMKLAYLTLVIGAGSATLYTLSRTQQALPATDLTPTPSPSSATTSRPPHPVFVTPSPTIADSSTRTPASQEHATPPLVSLEANPLLQWYHTQPWKKKITRNRLHQKTKFSLHSEGDDFNKARFETFNQILMDFMNKNPDERYYMKFVINHPKFSFFLTTLQTNKHPIISYQTDGTSIVWLETMIAQKPQELTRKLRYAFWHGYKRFINDLYQTTEGNSLPYRFKSLISNFNTLNTALEKGYLRITEELPRLLALEENQALSKQQQQELAHYKSALESYSPRLDIHFLSPLIADDVIAYIERERHNGRIPEKTINQFANISYKLNITGYELLSDGGLQVYGYPTDAIKAFIIETWKHDDVLARNWNNIEDMLGSLNNLFKLDCYIAENGPAINKVFYPEREAYHREEHKAFINHTKVMLNSLVPDADSNDVDIEHSAPKPRIVRARR